MYFITGNKNKFKEAKKHINSHRTKALKKLGNHLEQTQNLFI